MSRNQRSRGFLKGKSIPATLARVVAEEEDSLADYYVFPERFVGPAMDLDDPRAVFVGPKGAGKSAILKMVTIRRQSDSGRVILVSPDDLSLNALTRLDSRTSPLAPVWDERWLFKSLWDYVLTVEILRREFPTGSGLLDKVLSLFASQKRRDVRSFLEESLGDDNRSLGLTGWVIKLFDQVSVSVAAPGLSAAVGAKLRTDSTVPIQTVKIPLLDTLSTVVKQLPELVKHEYLVLIDDLDRYWNGSPQQKIFIAALFQSLRKLSRKPVKFIVALREGIFNSLTIEDSDKFRERICMVSWDASSMQQMVESRIRFAFHSPNLNVWGQLFPREAFPKLWNSTARKPREVLRLAYLCLGKAKENGNDSVLEEDIHHARRIFSEEKISDLDSEYGYRYRGIGQVVRMMAGWHKEFGRQGADDLAIAVAESIEKSHDGASYSWARGYIDDPLGLVKILAELGVLRIKQSRTDSARDWECETPIDINDHCWFSVHPMYAPALGCIGD